MSKSKLSVSVVIPNYNGIDLLKKNLASVVDASKKLSNRVIEVILVDDCSQDDSVSFTKDNFPEIKIIRHKINRGFAASVNTGVRTSKGGLICLLNNDVGVSETFLEPVFNHFRDSKVFAVSLHEKGFGWAKGEFKDGFIVHKKGNEDVNFHESFWASGGSAVFRRDYWTNFGGFDEKVFKFYWEDVDLSYRAQKRGFKIIWEPKALVYHKHESTTSKVFSKKRLQKMQEVNQLLFIWKNLTSQVMFKKHITGLLKRISKSPGYFRIVLEACLKIKIVLKERKREKKEAKISDEAIFAKFTD